MLKLIPAGAAILALGVATACAAKPSVTPNQTAKSTISSQTYIKPSAGIGYSHDLKSQYNVGETVNFRLKLGESYSYGIMRVNVSAAGLQLLNVPTVTEFDMSASESHEMMMSFTSSYNGRHYINVQALADVGDGNPMSRVFSIPVQVGPVTAQKPNPNMKSMPNGDKMIEMVAEEEIK